MTLELERVKKKPFEKKKTHPIKIGGIDVNLWQTPGTNIFLWYYIVAPPWKKKLCVYINK